MGDPASIYVGNLKTLTDVKPKFAICASCLTVERASFSIMDLILLMLDLVTADLGFPD